MRSDFLVETGRGRVWPSSSVFFSLALSRSVRFKRGGCDKFLSWTDRRLDSTTCITTDSMYEGLIMELECCEIAFDFL